MNDENRKTFIKENLRVVMVAKESLELEIKTFESNKASLLDSSPGKFVLIKGEEIVGTYDTQKDAIKVGIDKFGNEPFLVKEIQEFEETQNFTSNLIKLVPCPQ